VLANILGISVRPNGKSIQDISLIESARPKQKGEVTENPFFSSSSVKWRPHLANVTVSITPPSSFATMDFSGGGYMILCRTLLFNDARR